MKIGILGTGTIAQYLLENINKKDVVSGEIVAIFGRNQQVGKCLKEKHSIEFFTDFETFIDYPMDIIVEAATVEIAILYIEKILNRKKDIVLSSIGALKEEVFLKKMEHVARTNSKHIYLPSGAIGGLDLLQSAHSLSGLDKVAITTRKPPKSLGLINEQEEVIFKGSAREAIEKFPKNINVALLLSIAGIGADRTNVCVISDPCIRRNTHIIEVGGGFGNMKMEIENKPMPTNPKTSYLAALSILATLQNKEKSITIGN